MFAISSFPEDCGNTIKPNIVLSVKTTQKDGAVKQVYVTRRQLKFTGLFVALWASVWIIGQATRDYDEYQNNNNLKPVMEHLAGQGNDLASLWLVRHFYKDNGARLQDLVAKKNPEAMAMQAYVYLQLKDREGEGRMLMKEAANAGFAPAIKFLNNPNQRSLKIESN